ELSEDVEIEIDGDEADLDELVIGMDVQVKLEDKTIIIIDGEAKEEIIEIEGIIEELDLIGIYHITIDNEEYLLSREAKVCVDGEESQLEDLELGMEVSVEMKNAEIIAINGNSMEIEVSGSITSLGLEEGNIDIDNSTFIIADEVDVEINGEKAELEDLEVGMDIEAEVVNDKVTEISVTDETIENLEGTINGMDLADRVIVIDEEEYSLADDVDVKINDEDVELSELEEGMEIEFEILNDEISAIKVNVVEVSELEGEITDLDLIGIYHITVEGNEYQLSREATVTVDGEEVSLEDLEVGMMATITLNDELVVDVAAENVTVERVTGKIADLDLIGVYHITIGENEYELSKYAEIIVDGEMAQLEDLEVGMKVRIEIYDDELVKFVKEVIDSVITEEEGRVTEINLLTRYIVINDTEYSLSDNVEVIVNEEVSTLVDMEVGMYLQLEITNDKVTKINARSIDEIEAQGVVTEINATDKYIDIDEVRYAIADEVQVKLEDGEVELADLATGMMVEAEIQNGVITKIAATNVIKELEGNIYGMNYLLQGLKLTIMVDEDIFNYLVSDEAREEYVDELRMGEKAQFTIMNDVIVEILFEDK
ncbi:hypothetical protein, partial [Sporosalibacterium faouarense]|uniref:hypothetical protein n=1 Tax=Sporosalibacterium faouarense TaxID=516123 RepID=UPI00192A9844